jgi:hypothetical protein
MSEMFTALVLLGLLALFAIVIYLMVRSERRQLAQKEAVAQVIGFTSMTPDEDLSQRIGQIYQWPRRDDRFALHALSRQQLSGATIYLFDLERLSSGESNLVLERAVAILSPELNLPPFAIYPKADVPGWVAEMGNRALTKLIARRHSAVLSFPEQPEFGRRYIVTADDLESVGLFVRRRLPPVLSHTGGLHISAGGQGFIVAEWGDRRKLTDRTAVGERVALAIRIWQACRGSW